MEGAGLGIPAAAVELHDAVQARPRAGLVVERGPVLIGEEALENEEGFLVVADRAALDEDERVPDLADEARRAQVELDVPTEPRCVERDDGAELATGGSCHQLPAGGAFVQGDRAGDFLVAVEGDNLKSLRQRHVAAAGLLRGEPKAALRPLPPGDSTLTWRSEPLEQGLDLLRDGYIMKGCS